MAGGIAKKGTIQPLNIKRGGLHIIGLAPLLVHRWCAKAIRQILEKHCQLPTQGHERRDPHLDYVRSIMFAFGRDRPTPAKERFVLPARAFKACAVRGAKATSIMPMTDARQSYFLHGEWTNGLLGREQVITIVGVPEFNAQMVRLDNGQASIRFRGMFPVWAAYLEWEWNGARMSEEYLAQMLEAGGWGAGVAENRGELGGELGRFRLCTKREFDAVAKETERTRAAWFADQRERILHAQREDIDLFHYLMTNPEAWALACEEVGKTTGRAVEDEDLPQVPGGAPVPRATNGSAQQQVARRGRRRRSEARA